MTNRIITDIEGVIRELSISEVDVLFPLYEAVVNAIQAIDERKDNQGGKIGVYIERAAMFARAIKAPVNVS